jgi:hypothetical protein
VGPQVVSSGCGSISTGKRIITGNTRVPSDRATAGLPDNYRNQPGNHRRG